jgi:hypothetical protein
LSIHECEGEDIKLLWQNCKIILKEISEKCWHLIRDKSETNGMMVIVQKPQKYKMMSINKCCKNIEQEHQLKYIRHEEGKRNILSGIKKGNMGNKGVKKLKNLYSKRN